MLFEGVFGKPLHAPIIDRLRREMGAEAFAAAQAAGAQVAIEPTVREARGWAERRA